MPRAGLSAAVVTTEAGRLTDEVGPDRLTLAGVATRLGVRLPSLYKHIAGLDGLLAGVATAGLRELAAELSAAAVGRSGAAAVAGLAEAYRAFARRRPGVYALTVRAPDPADAEHTAAAAAVLDVVFAVLDGFGLSGDDAVDAVRGLRALMHGFVAIENAGGYRMPQDVDRSYQRLVAAYADALAAMVSARATVSARAAV